VIPVLLLAAIAACNAPLPATPAAPAVPSNTPFAPVGATPTPTVLTLWLSPALPARLRTPLEAIESVDGARLEVVATPEQAQVRAGPSADAPLARWVLAVVAPFPTVRDSITLDELRLAWSGASPASGTLFVTPAIAAALEQVFGEPAAPAVRLIDAGELVDAAWGARPSLAVVAFEDLEPRWKVLALDGRSPIANDFQFEGYPLVIPFGLSGEADGIARVQTALGSEEAGWPATNRDPAKFTSLMMTGVTALTRATAWRMEQRGLLYPAVQIGDWLRQADLTHVSNEVSFSGNCPRANPSPKIMRFCSPLDAIQLLDSVGVDIVELTGNHVNDFGTAPLRTTLDLYQERGWGVFGGGRTLEASMQPALVEHHGNRFAFLGCNPAGPPEAWATAAEPGATPCDMERLLASVRALKAQGYITVFTFQWAESARTAPLPAQVDAFRAAVDAGADIVQGSQAHQPQTLELYHDSLIHYGLGNLFFDQMQSLPNRQEVLDRHIIYDGRWISTELYTALLMDWAQPRPMSTDERAAFLEDIFRFSGW
jgi:poly-gamma-glutamate synthesis protein (capsule biosynthesis protein)